MTGAPTSLSEAVAAARRGDERGFRYLYDEFRERGLALLQTAYPDLGREAHDDLLQQTFAGLFRRIDSLRDPEAFGGWFKTSLLNRTRRRLHKTARDRQVLTLFAVEVDRGATLADIVQQELRHRAVHELIEGLSDESERRLAEMAYVEGATRQEIAAALGLSEDAVRTRLHRFRRRIRTELIRRVLEVTATPSPAGWRGTR